MVDKKLIVTITDKGKASGDSAYIDIRFEFEPSINMKDDSKNSRVLLDCFERIGEALGSKNSDKEKGVDEMDEDRLKKLEDRVDKLEKSQQKAVDSLGDMFAGVGAQMQGMNMGALGGQEEEKKDEA